MFLIFFRETLIINIDKAAKMRDNILVKKLVGIETAGSMNILFTDKTGTITNGKFFVRDVITFGYTKEQLLSFAASAYASGINSFAASS